MSLSGLQNSEGVRKLEEIEALRQQVAQLEAQVSQLRQQLVRAKDSSPVEKPSYKRVAALAANACMNLYKEGRRWVLQMGNLRREFTRLAHIWEMLTKDDWSLSDIFDIKHTPWKPARFSKSAKPILKNRSRILLPNPFYIPFSESPEFLAQQEIP